jgi:hypothetical protein
MDKYLLVIIGLIIFSILVILFVRIFAKTPPTSDKNVDNLKEGLDFTILE